MERFYLPDAFSIPPSYRIPPPDFLLKDTKHPELNRYFDILVYFHITGMCGNN